MPINFPNEPTLQVPTNEFSPTSKPLNTENGVTYTWDGEKWVASGSVITGDYVKIVGDNMTGDLTLGPVNDNKIRIYASDGSIIGGGFDKNLDTDGYIVNAGGSIEIGRLSSTVNPQTTRVFTSYLGTDRKIELKADGSAEFEGQINTARGVRATSAGASGSVGFAYLSSSSVNGVSLYAPDNTTITTALGWDGSATFANYIEVAGDPAIGSTGCRFEPSGIASVGRTDESQAVWRGFHSPSTTATSEIRADGSATFDRDVAIGQKIAFSGNGSISATIAGSVFIGGTLPSAPNISLNADGSIIAEGQIVTSDRLASYCTRPNRFEGLTGNVLELKTNNSSTDKALSVLNQSGVESAAILGDGSASFKGTVQTISLKQTASGTTDIYKQVTNPVEPIFGISSDINGTQYRHALFTADGSLSIGGDVSNNPLTKLNADGSADFQGTTTIGNPNTNSSTASGAKINAGGSIYCQTTLSTDFLFRGYLGTTITTQTKADGSASFASGAAGFSSTGVLTAVNVTFNLEADDDTKYTSTTDVDGNETRVYNGETLDMKEVGLALVALKAAAANATDFTSLKSAIATSLANL